MSIDGSIGFSALAALEPILGISIAINLAYLNLPKFQYISIVRDRLRARLDKLDGRVKNSIKSTPWYEQLNELASVEPFDLELRSFTKKWWVKSPGLWGLLYNVFFYWRFGRALSIFATAYALILLILGAGHTAGATDLMLGYFNTHIGRHFFWASISALWPIITVVVGEVVCSGAENFLNYQTGNLKERAMSSAKKQVDDLDEKLDAKAK